MSKTNAIVPRQSVQALRRGLLDDMKATKNKLDEIVMTVGVEVRGILLRKSSLMSKKTDKDGKSTEVNKLEVYVLSIYADGDAEHAVGLSSADLPVYLPGVKRTDEKDPAAAARERKETLEKNNAYSDAICPENFPLTAHRSIWLFVDTKQKASMDEVRPGDVVKLMGVHARGKDGEPGTAYPKGSVMLKFGVLLKDRQLPSSYVFREMKDKLHSSFVFRVPADPKVPRDDSLKILAVRATDQESLSNPFVVQQPPRLEATDWSYTNKQDKKVTCAHIRFAMKQWLDPADDDAEATEEKIYLNLVVWTESLAVFGWGRSVFPDADSWVALAPRIFENLNYHVFAEVNDDRTRNMAANIANDGSDAFSYSLSMTAKCLIADVPQHYREIGVPVSSAYIASRCKLSDAVVSAPPRANYEPPPLICVDGGEPMLPTLLNHPDVKFCVLVNIAIADLGKYSEKEGDALMDILENEFNSNYKKVGPICVGEVISVAFAIGKERARSPDEVLKRKEAMRILLGEKRDAQPPVDEEKIVDDDDGVIDSPPSQPQTQTRKRKTPADAEPARSPQKKRPHEHQRRKQSHA